MIVYLVLHACTAHYYSSLAGVPGQCSLIHDISNINDKKETSPLALVPCSVVNLKVCKGLDFLWVRIKVTEEDKSAILLCMGHKSRYF